MAKENPASSTTIISYDTHNFHSEVKASQKEDIFWIAYKDYVTVIITVLVTFIIQYFTNRSKKKNNTYQSQLFFYQGKVITLHEKFIEHANNLISYKSQIRDIYNEPNINLKVTRSQDAITDLENEMSLFTSKHLKLVQIYDKEFHKKYSKLCEKYQDKLTSFIAAAPTVATDGELNELLKKFDKVSNKITDQTTDIVKDAHPIQP